MFKIMEVAGSKSQCCKTFKIRPSEFQIFRLKYDKDFLFSKHTEKFQKKHALVMLMLPHYLTDHQFQFDHVTDVDKYGSSRLGSTLKAMITYDSQIMKYFTFVKIEGTWTLFTSNDAKKYDSLTAVYEKMGKNYLFPMVICYQTSQNKNGFCNDIGASNFAWSHYKKALSKSEKAHSTFDGFSLEQSKESMADEEQKDPTIWKTGHPRKLQKLEDRTTRSHSGSLREEYNENNQEEFKEQKRNSSRRCRNITDRMVCLFCIY